MPTYVYKAMTKHGQIVRNRISDASKEACAKKLKRNELIPITISKTFRTSEKTQKKPRNYRQANQALKKASLVKSKLLVKGTEVNIINQLYNKIMFSRKITERDIRVFTQNFLLLKKAGFNNVHALNTIINSTENSKFKLILEDILYGVEAGEYMFTTMEYYSDIFPFIYINMIKVGELSGSLELSLQQAVKYLRENENLKTKLRKILIPNITMFIGIIILLLVCVIIGLPIVQDIFESIGTTEQLPAITLWFADFVDKVIEYWYIPVTIFFVATGGIIFYINTPIGRNQFDMFKYKMPIFGKLIYLVDFDRLLKNMLLNLQNGIRIQDALNLSKSVIKNTIMRAMIDMAVNNIYVGKSWIEPFENTKFSNPIIIEMLKIGMQTDLAEMMENLLELMDMDIDNALERIMKVLPEVSYAVVGAVLIFFVWVVLVPCIQIYMGGFLFSAYADYI